ncbi:TPA: DNA replication protein, partial [Streptococcus pyogenes]|nr:DNA replication protein [Streptococcus pyogenes]HER1122317.1 DNA replication protein [Streptococcus pyogenes]HER1190792.1 DNA replication protein [Streptococcus pyogenes]HER1404315.1 DNA replication protein [Streptococcus pyogenes]HER1441333.1 DNA replication protein [Streptococcus pyogenes]
DSKKQRSVTTSNVPSWSNPDYKEPDLEEFALGSMDGIEDGSGDF